MDKQTKLDFEVKEIVIEYRMIYNCLINSICCQVLKIDNESEYDELTDTCLLITTEKKMKEIMYYRFKELARKAQDKIIKLKIQKFN